MGENVHEYEALCDSDGLSEEDNSGKKKSKNLPQTFFKLVDR